MKKLNNKGFAITAIIYSIMLLFVLILASFLSILIGRNKRTDTLINSIYNDVVYEDINVFFKNDGTVYEEGVEYIINEEKANNMYVTKERAIYHFSMSGKHWETILPPNTIVINNKIKLNGDDDKLYYYIVTDKTTDESKNVNNYNEL